MNGGLLLQFQFLNTVDSRCLFTYSLFPVRPSPWCGISARRRGIPPVLSLKLTCLSGALLCHNPVFRAGRQIPVRIGIWRAGQVVYYATGGNISNCRTSFGQGPAKQPVGCRLQWIAVRMACTSQDPLRP